MSVDVTSLAVDYLLAARTDDDAASELERELAAIDGVSLGAALADDAVRLAFWLDVYNAAVLRQRAYDFTTWRARFRFFSRPALDIAGRALSLDAIEHGILRRSRLKLGLGYGANPVASPFERAHWVDVVDPRIHFALNCAAASCPPIAAYRHGRIDAQLELATRGYLQQEARIEHGILRVPVLFLWFIGDFGGPPGVRSFLRDHGVEGWGRPLRFARWDWTPRPGKWAAAELVEER